MIIRAFKSLWRLIRIKINPIAYARKQGVKIGHNTRLIGIDDKTFGSEPFLISIGNHVTIAGQVKFINHDGGVWVFRQEEPDIELVKPITIGNNVFVGYRSIIMPGVTIGSNVVIGAGSLVVHDIPDNCVVAGVPAKVIRSIDEYREKIAPFVLNRTWGTEQERRAILTRYFKERESSQ